jgi:hypothetical protein
MGYGGGSATPKAKPSNFLASRFAIEGGRPPHVAQKWWLSHPKNYYYYYYYFKKKP